MTRNDRPVIVKLSCEATPSTDTQQIDRAEWDAMTPAQRATMLDNMVDEHIGNAGGGGWHIADPDDEAAVGLPEVLRPIDADEVMDLVIAYGAECGTNNPSGRADALLEQIRQAVRGKGA